MKNPNDTKITQEKTFWCLKIITFIVGLFILKFVYDIVPEWWKWLTALWTGMLWAYLWNKFMK